MAIRRFNAEPQEAGINGDISGKGSEEKGEKGNLEKRAV